MMTDKPKTFLDRVGRRNKNYIFISYSHKNCDFVYGILKELYAAGVNYWYDTELEMGDIWNEKVKDILFDHNCTGIVIFLSPEAILSNAVFEEIKLINKIDPQRPFDIFPVLVGIRDYAELLSLILEANLYQNIGEFTELFKNGDRTYKASLDENLIPKIVSFSLKTNSLDSSIIELRGSNLSMVREGLMFYYEIGSYPFDRNGCTQKIVWCLFNRVGNKLFFVSKYCLDFMEYEAAISITRRTFGLDKEDSVLDMTLITQSVIDNFREIIGPSVPTDFADEKRTQSLRLYWVGSDDSDKKSLRLYNSDNYEVNDVVPPENETFSAGIRLVLILDDKKIATEE